MADPLAQPNQLPVSPADWIPSRKALLIASANYSAATLADLTAPTGDVAKIRQVLVDPARGAFDDRSVAILEGFVSHTDMMSTIERFAGDAQPDDLLFLYFSGHAIAAPNGHVYLAASDTDPERSLRATGLASYDLASVLNESPSKHHVVVLDCCYAARFAPNIHDPNTPAAERIFTDLALQGDRRTAFLAAAGLAESAYERLEHRPRTDVSLFTESLLRGIESGGADVDGDGLVGLGELHGFIKRDLRERVGNTQTPSLHLIGEGAGQIALTRNPQGSVSPERGRQNLGRRLDDLTPREGNVPAMRLRDPLDALAEPLANLKEMLTGMLPVASSELGAWLLNGIVSMLGADFAFVLEAGGPTSGSRLGPVSQDKQGVRTADIRRAALDLVGRETVGRCLREASTGWFAQGDDGMRVMIIPLKGSQRGRLLVVLGKTMPEEWLSEPVATVCRAIFDSHRTRDAPDPRGAQIAAWDALKRRHGFVPQRMFRSRLDAFNEELQGVEPFFQPVLALDAHEPQIHGWEALARLNDPEKAPAELFRSAELWGHRFLRSLDMHMLERATAVYRLQSREPRLDGGGPVMARNLSVNVYPDTLMSEEYFEEVAKITLDGDGVPARELTLEISEKVPLPKPSLGEEWELSPTEAFKERIREFRDTLHIEFAIDDFGVDHGSIERVAGLSLRYIKVDQALTRHPSAPNVIAFLREMLSGMGMGGETLVVEGFRDQEPFGLKEAFAAGVQFVQGEFVGMPTPELMTTLPEALEVEIARAGGLGPRRISPARRR